MMRNIFVTAALVALIPGAPAPCHAQASGGLLNYLQQDVKLSQDQIASLRNGEAVAKNLDSRSPAEVVVFGVVYINA
ncbi:MAG TPA: hypothetical protein VMO17_11685, partial [Terriglobia bacterium]|nr:hypothetical protein [Terriglobia bacterium]